MMVSFFCRVAASFNKGINLYRPGYPNVRQLQIDILIMVYILLIVCGRFTSTGE